MPIKFPSYFFQFQKYVYSSKELEVKRSVRGFDKKNKLEKNKGFCFKYSIQSDEFWKEDFKSDFIQGDSVESVI